MANNPNAAANLKPFVKGDKRINTDGRPKDAASLAALARRISHEKATTKDGKPVLGPDGKPMTVAEVIMRQWAQDPKRQQMFIDRAFGKQPTPVNVQGDDEGGPVQVHNTQTIDLSGLSIEERQSLVTLIAKLESPEA